MKVFKWFKKLFRRKEVSEKKETIGIYVFDGFDTKLKKESIILEDLKPVCWRGSFCFRPAIITELVIVSLLHYRNYCDFWSGRAKSIKPVFNILSHPYISVVFYKISGTRSFINMIKTGRRHIHECLIIYTTQTEGPKIGYCIIGDMGRLNVYNRVLFLPVLESTMLLMSGWNYLTEDDISILGYHTFD